MSARRKIKYVPPIPGKLIVADTETTGKDVRKLHRPFLYTFANDEGQAMLLWEDQPVNSTSGLHQLDAAKKWGPNRRLVKAWMEDPAITKVFHNSKFDIGMMRAFGINVRGKVHDTMIMAHVLSAFGRVGDRGDHDNVLDLLALDVLSKKYLHDSKVSGIDEWIKANKKSFHKRYKRKPNYSDIPKDLMEQYALHDPVLTMKLFYLMDPHIDKLGLRQLYETEMRLMWAVLRMEERGIFMDTKFMRRRIEELKAEEVKSLQKLRAMAEPIKTMKTKTRRRNKQPYEVKVIMTTQPKDINFGSDKQMTKIICGQFGIHIANRTPTGAPKMDERTLSRIDHPFCKELIRYRQYGKTRGTYFEGYLERMNGYTLHPNYLQIGTASGRFSSRNPNLQNIPMEETVRERAGADVIYKGVKRAFIPRDGFQNYHFDYSQVEVRMMAHFAKDPKIDKAVLQRNIHDEICKMLFGNKLDPVEKEKKRVLAKIVTFGLLYGMGKKTFAWKLKVDMVKVGEILAHYYGTFPGIKRFQNETIRQVRETGQLRNLMGRRYLVDPQYGYKGVNYLCQGSAADVLKKAMCIIDDMLVGCQSNMLMQIHDEVMIEVHESEEDWLPQKVVDIMTDMPECRIPLKVSMEKEEGNWENLVKLKS